MSAEPLTGSMLRNGARASAVASESQCNAFQIGLTATAGHGAVDEATCPKASSPSERDVFSVGGVCPVASCLFGLGMARRKFGLGRVLVIGALGRT